MADRVIHLIFLDSRTSQRIWNVFIGTAIIAMSAIESSAQIFGPEDPKTLREQLVREVIEPNGVTDPRVLDAIRNTVRHEFVAPQYRAQAYYDMAIPIGDSQTISSPYIVAVMTEALETKPTDKVLEIGTGSGYQAAVLSPLVKHVYTIEIVQSLGESAQRLLSRLDYKNISVKVGDGFKGWPEFAPFDKIIVTCSPEDVPQPLVDQLTEGGLMVIPVGERYQQTLYLMRKKDGKLEREALRPTLFVPMTGTAEAERNIKADPANPKLLNGDFEEPLLAGNHVPGWYYQRGMELLTDGSSGSGKQFVRFRNDSPGRPTSLLQGLALDGRIVNRIRLSAQARPVDAKRGLTSDEFPAVAIQFFDEQRKRIGIYWVGPFLGTKNWTEDAKTFRVPEETREAIISIGLFGGTGTLDFDNVRLEVLKRN